MGHMFMYVCLVTKHLSWTSEAYSMFVSFGSSRQSQGRVKAGSKQGQGRSRQGRVKICQGHFIATYIADKNLKY